MNHPGTLSHMIEHLQREADAIRALTENSSDLIVVLDREGLIAYASPSVRQIVGYEPAEVTGRHYTDFIHAEDLPTARARFPQIVANSGLDTKIEHRYRHKNGSWVVLETIAKNALGDPRVGGIVVNARDVSERRNAELALRESEARFRVLAEVSPDGIFQTDARGNGLFVNRRWCEYAGMSEPEARGRGWQKAIHPEDRGRVAAAWYAAARGQLPYDDELRFVDRGGRIRWVIVHTAPDIDAEGKLRGYVGTVSDITERKESEERFRKSEERFRRYFELGLIGMAVTLPDKGIAEVNDALCGMLAYGRDELLGIDWASITHPDDLPADVAQFERLMAGDIERYTLDKRFIRKDGGLVHSTISVSCVLRDDRSVDHVVALVQDMTARKQAEKTLREALVATVGAMAATVESRDPYTAGHQRRVADLAAAIAREMGLPSDMVEGIHFGAVIHDLGKVQVPAEILSKPGKLTKPEFDLIKMHPQAGYDIVKGIKFPWRVAEMVHQHHERLDGSGYPQGLKGEEIALEARILSVADVVEAMASHRPYRPGLGIEVALKEIQDKRARWFDPAAVDACVRLFREGRFQL